jgi:hypothetical protein
MPHGKCLLCHRESELQHSHILPAFVFRWLRESSGGGFLRSGSAPNRRTQDGEKRYWLCSDCEQLFGSWENLFADRLFYPYLRASGGQFGYAHWLMRFCTSVSWRALHFFLDESRLADWNDEALERARKAESAWRDYLLGARRRPGEFRQHLLPLDRIANSTDALVPFINRYLMRAVQMDILRGQRCIFALSKLGRFVIVGIIHEPNPERWRGTEVSPVHGVVRPRNYQLPSALVGYFTEKAQRSHELLSGLSERQQKRIDATFRANIERYAGSDAFMAMHADVEMFGETAFTGAENYRR